MKQRAFTLIEMLVAMAIMLVLFGAMITATKHLKAESQRRMTASAIAVLSTALEQYYENTSPKQYPPQIAGKAGFDTELSKTTSISPGTMTDPNVWNSGAAYYFLSRVPQSRAILESLSNQMFSNRDAAGVAVLVTIPPATAGIDFVRFVDAWGTSLNYRYQAGDSFPVVTSAGPDKKFNTGDDVVSQ